MQTSSFAALTETLTHHLELSKSRVATFAMLIVGMIGSRTVNLSHIASERGSPVKIASTYRRFQRFFQHVDPGPDFAARLIVALLGIKGQWTLCLDRTNWKIGTKDVNILTLALVTRRCRVPLMWSLLDGPGNSSTSDRIALMDRYLAVFGAGSVKVLLADREFIGLAWLAYLNKNDIAFVIRIKANMIVVTEDGRQMQLSDMLRTARGPRRHRVGLQRQKTADPLWFDCAAKRIKGGELLIVLTNKAPHLALNTYRKRWNIECMFADAKTRGLNLEDTRLTIAYKLNMLLAVVAIGIAWSTRAASILIGKAALPRKKHGYKAKSWFRIGFDSLRSSLRGDTQWAFRPWLNLRKMPRVV